MLQLRQASLPIQGNDQPDGDTQHRILVVDDEEFCLFSMKALLILCGVDVARRVDFCFGGQQAIDKVKNTYSNQGSYQLILTDFSMPIVDGIETTE